MKDMRKNFGVPQEGHDPAVLDEYGLFLKRAMIDVVSEDQRPESEVSKENLARAMNFTPPPSDSDVFEIQRLLHSILDRYKMPIFAEECLEWYFNYNQLRLDLVKHTYQLREQKTAYGRSVVQISIDALPSKKEWDELYEELQEYDSLMENENFGADQRQKTPNNLEFDMALVEKMQEFKKVSRLVSDFDIAFELQNSHLKYKGKNLETKTSLRPLVANIKKRRQMIRDDIKEFFEGEEMDF